MDIKEAIKGLNKLKEKYWSIYNIAKYNDKKEADKYMTYSYVLYCVIRQLEINFKEEL